MRPALLRLCLVTSTGVLLMMPLASLAAPTGVVLSAAASTAVIDQAEQLVSDLQLSYMMFQFAEPMITKDYTADPDFQSTVRQRLADPEMRMRLNGRVARLVAEKLSQQEMEALARMMRSPLKGKLSDYLQTLVNDPRARFDDKSLTLNERDSLSMFLREKTPVTAYGKLCDILRGREMGDQFVAFLREERLDLKSILQDTVLLEARLMRSMFETGNDTPPTEAPGSLYGKFLRELAQKVTRIGTRYTQDLEKAGIADIISTPNLAAPERVRAGLSVLQAAFVALATREASMETTYEALSHLPDAYVAQYPGDSYIQEVAKAWQSTVEQSYKKQLVVGENQRRQLNLYQRILELVAANQKLVSRNGGDLLIQDEEVRRQFNELLAEAWQEAGREQEFRSTAMNTLRNLTENGAP